MNPTLGRRARTGDQVGILAEHRRVCKGPIALSLLLILTNAAAIGAGIPGQAVVLRVGPIEITQDRLYREFHGAVTADTSTLTPDHRGLARFVSRYTDQVALYAEALRDSTVLTPARRISLEESTGQILRTALVSELLPQYTKIDDAVLRTVYGRMGTKLKLAAVRVPTYAELDSVKAALAAGASFPEVARKWSRDPVTAAAGGELGWFKAADFPIKFQEVLWSLPVGSQSPTIEEPDFHSIYMVLDSEQDTTLGSFEAEREKLYQSMVRPLLGKAGSEMYADLMAAYHFRIDPDNAEWIRAFFQKGTAGVRRGFDPSKDQIVSSSSTEDRGQPEWPGTPFESMADALRPIAYVDGDTLNAITLFDRLMFVPSMAWAMFDKLSDVSDLSAEALYERVQEMEARKRGLDKRPEVAREILFRRGTFSWRGYRQMKIIPNVEPTVEELRALYEAGKSKYDLPERRRFVLVNVPTLDLANQAVSRLRKGMVPTSIVREIGRPELNFLVTPDTTAGWMPFGQNPGIDMVLFGMKKGEVSSPVADQGGYSVLRLEDVSPAHLETFENVQAGLRAGLVAQREQTAIAELLQRIRPEFKVWTDSATIAAMPLDPTQLQKRVKGPLD